MTDQGEHPSAGTDAKETAAIAQGVCPKCGAPRQDVSTPCAQCGAPPLGPASPARVSSPDVRRPSDMVMQVRASDMEPYAGLRYLSKLFRLMAIILLLVLIGEVVLGFLQQGRLAIPTLLALASRLVVFGAVLWASGDIAILLIDVGHDIRATCILLGRQAARHLQDHAASQKDAASGERKTEREPR